MLPQGYFHIASRPLSDNDNRTRAMVKLYIRTAKYSFIVVRAARENCEHSEAIYNTWDLHIERKDCRATLAMTGQWAIAHHDFSSDNTAAQICQLLKLNY